VLFVFVSLFSVLAKRLAGKIVSKMTYFVSGGMQNVKLSVSHHVLILVHCWTPLREGALLPLMPVHYFPFFQLVKSIVQQIQYCSLLYELN